MREDGVFCLKVAEVENLFVVPGLLDLMADQLGCAEGTAERAKQFIQNLFSENKANQIGEAFIKEVNHQLTLKNFSDKHMTPSDIRVCLDTDFSETNIETFYAQKEQLFNSAQSVDEILRIFNFKNLSKAIGNVFGLRGNEYPQRVINLIKRNPNNIKSRIIEILLPYLPELP